MGVDFNALLFYGMQIEGELEYGLLEAFGDANDKLEIANLSPMSRDSTFVLFVRESYHAGDKHDDEVLVKLSDVTGKEAQWRQLIVDACIANGLTFVEPDWYFATTFS